MSPLLPPNSNLKTSEDFPDVCLASDFRPNANAGTHGYEILFAAFSNETMDYCSANDAFSNHRNVDICENIHPGNATVNFYLLIMNAVRVVLTKVMVISTLLTIKALVH
ncbi:hypothetical protein OJAV_G00169920 [Oryzias javanicus]|uniref:Uncharacterized protein n=1 Tax=Oryzias javanicus TaxID=123683 RepID=A0A3S2LUD6_ORYJA|nr:hypothetical protein OJAV_G00169920 [Oryzias javanicus]